jgi:hypothetical protein
MQLILVLAKRILLATREIELMMNMKKATIVQFGPDC